MTRPVTVLFNDDHGLAAGDALDALAAEGAGIAARAVAAALASQGHDVEILAAPEDLEGLARALGARRDRVIFNLCEALRGETRLEAAVGWMLELAGMPYTGAPPRAMALAIEKPLARAVLVAAGVPVPRGREVADPGACLDDLTLPAIVKPSREDASHGISAASVVRDPAALRERVAYVCDHYRQSALIEEFVDGRELNVSILGHGDGPRILPPAEIDFSGFPADLPRIITYAAKWQEESAEYRGSVSVRATGLAPALLARIEAVAVGAFSALGLAGYGRVDLRLCPQRGPLVIDVNPNPDISPDAGLALAAARGGLSYAELVTAIVDEAVRRHDPAASRR